MKATSIWGRILHRVAGGNGRDLQGILAEPEFRRLLEYERALSDRHERRFSLLLFSQVAGCHSPRFNAHLIELLKNRLRMTDVVGWVEEGRVGVILPYSDQAGARIVADDVCTDMVSRSLKARCELHTYPGEESDENDRRDGTTGSGSSSAYPAPRILVGGAVGAAAGSQQIAFTTVLTPHNDISSGARLAMMSLLTSPLPYYKRVFDVAISLAGLILVSPVMLLVAGFIKVVSPGPVFFKQERVGHLGGRFLCWKFRTMTVAADAGVHRDYFSGLMKSDAPMTKLDNRTDSRLIPCGKFLRASGLDELPQLYNVLRGEMSFVGPRPCIQYEYNNYQRWHKRRFDTLPGLTGLWQVSGKNQTSFSEMMRLDVSYSQTKSLRHDVTIVWRTFPVLIEQVRLLVLQRARDGRQQRESHA